MQWWEAATDAVAKGEIPTVAAITHDSRRVTGDTAFVAIRGGRFDGHDFLAAAVDAGAPVCVVETGQEAVWSALEGRVPLVVVEDTRDAIGYLAAAVNGNPSEKLRTIGVTGTDGKTTTTHLTGHVLEQCGLRCGYLSSVGFDTGAGFVLNESHMTTVESTAIQTMLASALRNDKASMVVEASSEGLAQGRLNGCVPDVAVFTNLSRDHLDFHGTMERYLEAKGRIFRMLDLASPKSFPRCAVLNADDDALEYLRSLSTAKILTYGVRAEADVRASDLEETGKALRFDVRALGKVMHAEVPLLGAFNVHNSLAAIASAWSQGIPLRDAVDALASFPGIPGRMERLDVGQAFDVVIDIASTPVALANVLTALRPGTTGRVWAVFGAAGGRDPARRSGMGEVAAGLADRVVLTNEDPRDEDPDVIIGEIASALVQNGRSEGSDFVRVSDRTEAIRYAFEHASAGDTVLLAGKATETTMVFKDGAIPWDERAVASGLLG